MPERAPMQSTIDKVIGSLRAGDRTRAMIMADTGLAYYTVNRVLRHIRREKLVPLYICGWAPVAMGRRGVMERIAPIYRIGVGVDAARVSTTKLERNNKWRRKKRARQAALINSWASIFPKEGESRNTTQ